MKLIARVFAFSLVITGALASAHIAGASQPSFRASVSAAPVPMCPPDGSTSCGMGSNNGSPASPK